MDDENEVIDGEFENAEAEEVIEDSVDTGDDIEADEEEAEEEGSLTVTIGDDEPEEKEKAPEWVRELRAKNREDQRRIKELEAKLNEVNAPKKEELGKKPTLDDFDYDADKFEVALEAWHEKKRKADEEQRQKQQAEEQQQKDWQARLEAHGAAKASLKVADYDDAESVVQDMFNVMQQGIIVQGADNSALVVYALGKNEKKAKELSSITDPVKFAFAIAKLETQLKVSGKKSPPPPEKSISGTAKSSGAVDSTLNRLRDEAAKTGDYTKVHEYKRSKKRA